MFTRKQYPTKGRPRKPTELQPWCQIPTYTYIKNQIKPLTDQYASEVNDQTYKSDQNPAQRRELSVSEMCDDCINDCYPPKINEILLYLYLQMYSERVETMPYTNRIIEQSNIQKESKEFKIERCSYGSFHLSKDNKRILMCKEAFRTVSKMHGTQHRMPDLIKTRIQTGKKIHFPTIQTFVKEFPYFCEFCSSCLEQKPNKFESPIWDYIDKDTHSFKFQNVLESVKVYKSFNVFDCKGNNCRSDQYDKYIEEARFCFLARDFPLQSQKQTDQQYIAKCKRLLKMVQKIEIRECNRGTYHLWISNKKIRIPMKGEKVAIAAFLHGDQHLNAEKMFTCLLTNMKEIYPNGMWCTIQQYVKQCQICRKNQQGDRLYNFIKNRSKKQQKSQNSQRDTKKSTLLMTPHRCKILQLLKIEEGLDLARESIPDFYDRINELLQRFPLYLDLQNYKQAIQKKFQLFNVLMDYVEENMFWINKTQQKYFRRFRSHGLIIKEHKQTYRIFPQGTEQYLRHKKKKTQVSCQLLQENDFTRCYLFYTNQMKYNYLKYGECLNILYEERLLKQRTINGNYFLTALLFGKDEFNEHVLFGMMLIDENGKINSHKAILEKFFEEMDHYVPYTIVTNQNYMAEYAIQKIRIEKGQNGIHEDSRYFGRLTHYLQWYDRLQILKGKVKKQLQPKRIMELFSQALQQKQQKSYVIILNYISTIMMNLKTLKHFDKWSHKYCLSKLNYGIDSTMLLQIEGSDQQKFLKESRAKNQKQLFTGFSMSTPTTESIYKDIANNFIYQDKMSRFLTYFLNSDRNIRQNHVQVANQWFQTQSPMKDKNNIFLLDHIPELLFLQNVLSGFTFNILLQKCKMVFVPQKERPLVDIQLKQIVNSYKMIILETLEIPYSFLDKPTSQPEILRKKYTVTKQYEEQRVRKYFLIYSLSASCWYCTCKELFITGIPCIHLIYIVKKYQGDLRYYVSSRWNIQERDVIGRSIEKQREKFESFLSFCRNTYEFQKQQPEEVLDWSAFEDQIKIIKKEKLQMLHETGKHLVKTEQGQSWQNLDVKVKKQENPENKDIVKKQFNNGIGPGSKKGSNQVYKYTISEDQLSWVHEQHEETLFKHFKQDQNR